MAPRPTGSPSTRPIGAVAIGQPAIDGALVIGEAATTRSPKARSLFHAGPKVGAISTSAWANAGSRQVRRAHSEVAGPGRLIGTGAGPAQFECPLEQVVAEVGQLRRRVALFVRDDLGQVLRPVGPTGRQVAGQPVEQLAQHDRELVLVLR